jgi:hypothetical protein
LVLEIECLASLIRDEPRRKALKLCGGLTGIGGLTPAERVHNFTGKYI